MDFLRGKKRERNQYFKKQLFLRCTNMVARSGRPSPPSVKDSQSTTDFIHSQLHS